MKWINDVDMEMIFSDIPYALHPINDWHILTLCSHMKKIHNQGMKIYHNEDNYK